ncbi:dihydroflavonol-4-reductase [Sphingomonas laterariae]|uniref:Dihydroflavonol-4-reductase n=1 Tax=Edaphosphingomonas laterariae TaxID=861865 RepID=A0A239BBQ2_9SPHN|nr:NAD-dependent epimerase/dehydratase family protein [Sphingomonas laterariae]SNS05330.1 dihydroflavonol-4-reductase [Sphingomonas laterariae]
MSGTILVTGAGGFLGSHVVRQLAADGRRVRAFVRKSTNVAALAGLPIEWAYGDALDPASVHAAMAGCESVIHCVVNTQAWLRDPTPMLRVNVDGLRIAIDAALAHGVQRFVMTSTIGTIGLNPGGLSTEEDIFNWAASAGPYIRGRVEAEALFFDAVRQRGLPGVAMCVANTYGPDDFAPTPHGRLLAAAASGKLGFTIDAGLSCVGIEDAATAMILAVERGRIGERYIVADRWLRYEELCSIAADQAGQSRRFRKLPFPLLYAAGFLADGIARLRGRDSQLSVESVRLSHIMNDMSAAKARTELGWRPQPVERSIRAAVDCYRARGLA